MDIIEEKCDEPGDDRQLIRHEYLARHLAFPYQRQEDLRDLLKRKDPEMCEEEATSAAAKYLLAIEHYVKAQDEHYTGLCLQDMLRNPDFLPLLIPAPATVEVSETPTEAPVPPEPAPIQEGDEVLVPLADVDMPPAEENEFVLPPALPESASEALDQSESQILRRVAELKKEGLWSESRMPLCVEPLRNKTHWDYLLEEVVWMARDFHQERRFKISACRKLILHVERVVRLKRHRDTQTVQKDVKKAKKHCAQVAKIVRDFWRNVNKVVDYKAQEILECRKRKALDEQLNFIVGQADKLSTIVKEGLTKRGKSIRPMTRAWTKGHHDQVVPEIEKESDNESTMSEEEKELQDCDAVDELALLASEAAKGYEELLAELPAEYLALHGLPVPAGKKIVEEPSLEGNGDGRGALKHVDYDKLNSLDAKDREQELEQIAEQVLQFQPRGHTLETTQVKTPVPFLIRGTLREYQMVGLDWLVTLYEKNLNGILADEMGLGKTIQTIALLAHLAGAESVWGPHLIIVPTSVILNWEMELKKWCPALKILTYFGTVKERAEKRKGWLKPNNFHVVIGSYQTVTQDIRSFKCRSWQYMILDEAQNIKNWKSRRWQWLLNIRARRRLLLTGTPLQNSLMELWSLMHFLMPSIFGSRDDFKDWFNNPLTGMMEGSIEYNGALVQRLHKVLRPFILRRMKNEVEKQLPAKTELVVSCQLSKRQRFLYDDYMSRRDTRDNLKTGNTLSVLNIVMQLRKCCNHPNLFEPRSVQSPFFHPPVKINIPAMFFDIVTGVPEEPKPIPACLDLRRRAVSCKSQTDARIPKLKELKQLEPTRPPKLAGFYLKAAMRPVLPARIALNDARSSSRLPAPKRSLELNPSFKSYTANFPLAVQPVKADGFNCVMAESGVGEGYKFSPPLKLRKKKEVISQYNALVPEEIKAGRTENRRFRLKLARARFETNPPLIAQELLDSVQLGAAEWTIDIQSDLGELQEIALKKFSLFVEPVQVDSPIWTATSAGRNVHVRWAKDELKLVARRFLEETDPLVNARLLSSRLQFPETRLIEYDCGKLQTLALLLRQLHLYKHRCLIFTQMSRMLDILQAFLSHHGYTYFRLDGSTSIEQRQQMMEQFNADSRIFCFILSTRSGGVGINLTGADTVIFYDSDWNPTMDAQAQDRCHRIGQTKDVTIYRLISESTIEENILKKARQKRRLGEVAIDEAGFTPEFFKQTDNIRDLFEGQTVGLEIGPVIKGGPTSQKELEAAMAEREDPQDREAMSKAAAEAGIDTAEFLDADKEKTIMRFTTGGVDPDDKYLELIGQLKPIERYAVDFLMAECMPDLEEPTTQDSIAETDEEPEPSRELSPDGLEEDIYACGSILDEIETFPDVNPPCPFSTWYPRGPSPEGDIYYNICLDDRYEREFMEDARLPTQIHDFPNYLTKSVPPKPSLPIPPSLLEPVLSKPTKKRKGTVTKGRAKSAAVTKTKAAFLDELPTPKKTVRKSTTEKSVEASDSSELTQLVKIRKQDAERQNKSLGPVQMAPTMPKKPLFPMHLLKKQTSQESFATPPPPTIPQHQGPKTNVPPKPKMSLSPLDDILPEKKKKLVIIPRDPRIDRGLPKKLPEKPPTLQRMIPISSEVMPPQFERKEPVLGPFNYPPPPLIPWHSQSPVYPPHLFRLPPPPPSDSFVLPPAPQHHGPKTNIPPRLKIISQNPLDELLPPEDARRQ